MSPNRHPDPPPEKSKLTKYLPKTISAASWISPNKWAEQAIENEMMKKPEAPATRDTTLGELDLPPETRHHKVVMDDGGEIHVVELGSGTPIVLLHGVLLSVATWPYQLRELSKYHRVIAIDQRGHGRSTTGLEGYSLQRLSRDLFEVLDTLNVKEAILVGHSMGGMVSMTAAAFHPKELANHVSGMVLVATSGDPLFNAPGLPFMLNIVAPWIRIMFEILSGREALAKVRPLRYLSARIILGGKPSPTNIEFAKALIRAASARILGELWSQLIVFDVTDFLPNITIPTRVLVGDGDLLTPPWHSIRIVKAMPNAELIRFAECGHMIMFERHKEMNEIILKFARQVQTTKGGTVARRRIAKSKKAADTTGG